MVPLSQNPRGRTLVIIITMFMTLDFIGVALRVYARRIKRSKLELNDWAIIISVTLIFVHFIFECVLVGSAGLGLNDEDIRLHHGGETTLVRGRRLIFIVTLIYNFAVLSIKVSILHFYLVVFRPMTVFRKVVYATMGASVAVCLAIFTASFFQCDPLRAYWDPTISGATCHNPARLFTAAVITGTILDIIIFVLPLPIIMRLQMRPKEKYGVMIAFTTGLVVCVIAIIRTYWTVTYDFTNTFYSIWYIALFGQIEPQLAAFSACMPILPTVVKHLVQRRRGLSQSKRSIAAPISSQGPSDAPHAFERLTDSDVALAAMVRTAGGPYRGPNNSIHAHTPIEVIAAPKGCGRDPYVSV